MGRGDNLMATGLARGAAARGKRIAFGDGRRISWDQHSAEIFRGNPNIAAPGSERAGDLEWIDFRKGHRIYNSISPDRSHWIWNEGFRAIPGELFFDEAELAWAATLVPQEAVSASGANRDGHRSFVAIEPNVEYFKSSAPNKDWPEERYQAVAARLAAAGRDVVQFVHAGGPRRLHAARPVSAPSFRHAVAGLARAALYIGPEGGMHHGAAAVGVPAVVLFGGFIPPAVTGYEGHANLTGGAAACGSLKACAHCRRAMLAIEVDEVMEAAEGLLRVASPSAAERVAPPEVLPDISPTGGEIGQSLEGVAA